MRGSPSEVGAAVVLDGETFKVVDEFIYLGTLVTCDNEVSREIKRRIAAANRAFYGLRPAVCKSVLNLHSIKH